MYACIHRIFDGVKIFSSAFQIVQSETHGGVEIIFLQRPYLSSEWLIESFVL